MYTPAECIGRKDPLVVMRKHVYRWHSLLLLLLLMSAILFIFAVKAKTPKNVHSIPAQLEYLDRGTVAVKTDQGVYLSWRLLGTENYDTSF